MDCCCNSPIFRMVGRLSVAAAVFHVMLTYAFAYVDGRRESSFALNNVYGSTFFANNINTNLSLYRRSGDEYGPTVKKDERWPIVSSAYGEITSVKISDAINGFY
ncbi:hypothetical protein Tco_0245647 [Tanacetum coccineum]